MNFDIKTYSVDGRKSIQDLYDSFSGLAKGEWIKEEIVVSRRESGGEIFELPVYSFRTKKKGNALWIIAGIHGEEPAGPNAISKGLEYIKNLGGEMQVILLPLCNPLGYASNFRYPRLEKWVEGKDDSVGDSEHLLFSDDLKNPRRKEPKNLECDALTKHVLKLAEDYKPILTIDLHEDNLLHDGGYIYVNCLRRYESETGNKIIDLLSRKVPIKYDGLTRFNEEIIRGIIANEKDGSIDELLNSEKIIVNGEIAKGPGSKSSIVVETPATMSLEKRVEAHLEILKNLKELVKIEQ